MKKILYILACTALTFMYVVSPVVVHADNYGEDVSEGSGASKIIYTTGTLGYIETDDMSNEFVGYSGPKWRRESLRLVADNVTKNIPFHAFYFKNPGSTSYGICYWQYDSEYEADAYLQAQTSNDSVIWNNVSGTVYRLSQTFTYNDGGGVTGSTLHFQKFDPGYSDTLTHLGDWCEKYTSGLIPRIDLQSGQDYRTILAVISGDLDTFPWNFTDSSGGRHFSDGTSLTPEQNRQYENVFVTMDANHDNTISEEEVNNYNTTYNTNYTYQTINEGNDFDEMKFLNYIAILFANGQDVPGSGGSGNEGSGSGSGNGTMQQQQKIESGAVVVNNNNSNMSVTDVNQVLNATLPGSTQDAFNTSLATMSQMTGLVNGAAAFVGAVLSFLPGWITTLIGVVFTLIVVMIVFRIIHLF